MYSPSKESHAGIAKVLIASCLFLPVLLIYFINIPLNESSSGSASSVDLSFIEQVIIIAAVFVLKPIYQVISLIIVIMLWRHMDTDIAALRRGTLSFFIGENACAINYLFFNNQSLFMEFLHSYGMLAGIGLITFSGMETFDRRFLSFSDRNKKCAFLPVCGRCYKNTGAYCNLRLLFLLAVPATMVIAAIPLTASLGTHFFEGDVFGHPVIFGHPVVNQLLEIRLLPLISIFLFAMSFLCLLILGENGFKPARVFYAMGTGPLGFSLMRFFLYWGFQQNPYWADIWEEITEFLFVLFLFLVVLRTRTVYRQHDLHQNN